MNELPFYLRGKGTLEDFLRRQADKYNIDPRDIPVHLAGSPEWDLMDPSERDRVLGGVLRNVIITAVKEVEYYRDHPLWSRVQPGTIESLEQFDQLPVIVKDDIEGSGGNGTDGLQGFRKSLLKNPDLLVPGNIQELIARQERANPNHEEILHWYGGPDVLADRMLVFGSGASEGDSTFTKLSYLTVEMETWALVRGLYMNGFREGQHIACMYAPTHKGGLQLQRAASLMGMPFHSKEDIFTWIRSQGRKYATAVSEFKKASDRKDFEAADRFAGTLREGIRSYIKYHNIAIIEAVQPVEEGGASGAKGMGLSFMRIFREDPERFNEVQHAFLTGYTVPEFAYEELQNAGIVVSTTWGSTECMALATSGHIFPGNVNNLTSLHYPTAGLVFKYLNPGVQKVAVGEEGIMSIFGLHGTGSMYLGNAMDLTTRTDGGYLNIHRFPSSKGIVGGNSCAADALSV